MKIDGEFRAADFRAAGMPSVRCPKWHNEWKCISHCMSCDRLEAGQWKKDGTVSVWCGVSK